MLLFSERKMDEIEVQRFVSSKEINRERELVQQARERVLRVSVHCVQLLIRLKYVCNIPVFDKHGFY